MPTYQTLDIKPVNDKNQVKQSHMFNTRITYELVNSYYSLAQIH